jgi:hypothetical protein
MSSSNCWKEAGEVCESCGEYERASAGDAVCAGIGPPHESWWHDHANANAAGKKGSPQKEGSGQKDFGQEGGNQEVHDTAKAAANKRTSNGPIADGAYADGPWVHANARRADLAIGWNDR